MRRILVLLALASAVYAPAAGASQVISTTTATGLTLGVNSKGEALLTYTSKSKVVHVLAWGAVNAIAPTRGLDQVAFRLDYSGGFDKYYNQDPSIQKLRIEFTQIRHTPGYLTSPVTKQLQHASEFASNYWKTGGFSCGNYDGPALAWLVTACKAPDGTYWAVQSWQRLLPDYGVTPTPTQSAWEVHLAHWQGPLPVLTVQTDWAWHRWDHIFGTYAYDGNPVFGFKSTSVGAPLDSFGRNLYVDTFDSKYGSGWDAREQLPYAYVHGCLLLQLQPARRASGRQRHELPRDLPRSRRHAGRDVGRDAPRRLRQGRRRGREPADRGPARQPVSAELRTSYKRGPWTTAVPSSARSFAAGPPASRSSPPRPAAAARA
jgi:hypothetical protein